MRRIAIVMILLVMAACGADTGSDDDQWSLCDGQPECPQGYEKLPEGSSCSGDQCEQVTECGESILCTASVCEAVPVCPIGSATVASDYQCPADASCYSLTECGVTTHCCDGPMPVCPEGATEVRSSSDCPQDDVDCYEVYEEACDQSVWCWEETTSCECPDGDPDCLDDPDSGRVYFDECPASFCDGPPEMCDPCFEHGPYFDDECGCGCEPRQANYCAISDAQAQGECRAIVGYAFDGDECISLEGCECEGDDCDRFDSLEECERTTGDCDGRCGDPDAPICSFPEIASPDDCPEGSVFTVDDCETMCLQPDSCELFDDAP